MSTSSQKQIVEDSVANASDKHLAAALFKEYEELLKRFYAADYRPSELSGGRFSEVAFRICEHVCLGTHSTLSKPLNKVDDLIKKLEQSPSAGVDDTFRIHIPRTLRLIYDLRNKRDVAHLGAGVSPNYTDASLVVGCTTWVVCEIIRVFHQCSTDEAQEIVNRLFERRTSFIWSEAGITRVLRMDFSAKDRTLIALYHYQNDWVPFDDLLQAVRYSSRRDFVGKVLVPLDEQAQIHIKGETAKILPPGVTRVEQELLPQLDGT